MLTLGCNGLTFILPWLLVVSSLVQFRSSYQLTQINKKIQKYSPISLVYDRANLGHPLFPKINASKIV